MKLFNKAKDDKGAANTVSFIVIMFFVMTLLVSFIDVGVYFNVKNEMRSAAENGARNVALYGGTEGALRESRSGVNTAEKVVKDSISSNYQDGSVVNVKDEVCGVLDDNGDLIPNKPKADRAGNSVACIITYEYKGLAGKFGLFQLGGQKDVVVKGVSVSEVGHN